MIRLRKYRIFAFVSVIVLFAVYYYGRDADWEDSYPLDQLRDYGSRLTGQGSSLLEKDSLVSQSVQPPIGDDQVQLQEEAWKQKNPDTADPKAPAWPALPVKDVSSTSSSTSTSTSSSSTSSSKSTTTSVQRLPVVPAAGKVGSNIIPTKVEVPPVATTGEFIEAGRGRLDVEKPVKWDGHWTKPTSLYPIPSESLIQLPTGVPKRIPTVQFGFSEETATAQRDRESKLASIKNAMSRSWNAYRKYAWMHDEVRPVTAGKSHSVSNRTPSFRDPFGGWAATLVDSLDTLYIMGMQEEFEDAVNATSNIDFTTCARKDIPLFETVIRYLGGLLGAYDVSGQKYGVLLDKAVELAEVLMGAFDTPNHMPMTYYHWMPTEVAVNHEAGTGVVMAELGSLSVEFTRLAQITKQAKYYDAIARITNEFEKFQNNSMLPGMWPTFVDASSGCDRSSVAKPSKLTAPKEISNSPITAADGKDSKNLLDEAVQSSGPATTIAFDEDIPDQRKDSSTFGSDGVDLNGDPLEKAPTNWPQKDASSFGADSDVTPGIAKRQFVPTAAEISSESLATPEECVPLGLRDSKHVFRGKYTLGGLSDSTYEYLPKEYLLLGGFNDQYESMYTSMIDTVREYLLYRPMTEDEADILFTGSYTPLTLNNDTGRMNGWFEPDTGHLTCFIGGMFGLGAKIFNRPEDLETAIKLTDACVWSYASTRTGVAPEDMTPSVCEDMTDCPWNETKWFADVADEGVKIDNALRTALEQFDGAEKFPAMSSVTAPAADSDGVTEGTSEFASLSSGLDNLVASTAPVQSSNIDKRKRQLDEVTSDPVELTSAETITTDDEALPVGQAGSIFLEDEGRAEIEDTTFSNGAAPVTTGQIRENLVNSLDDDEKEGVSVSNSSPKTAALGAASSSIEEGGVIEEENTSPATREEAIRDHIERQRLWPGMVAIKHRKYILRPEAIESVFYMYRITGDESWRTKGWTMFQAIERVTRTDIAYSAIRDATSDQPTYSDEMESFWTAETLKYFYLLFSDPSVISLDEYVLNTEAHPFLRPDAQVPEELLLAKVEALKTLDEDYSQPHRQEPDIFGVPGGMRV